MEHPFWGLGARHQKLLHRIGDRKRDCSVIAHDISLAEERACFGESRGQVEHQRGVVGKQRVVGVQEIHEIGFGMVEAAIPSLDHA